MYLCCAANTSKRFYNSIIEHEHTQIQTQFLVLFVLLRKNIMTDCLGKHYPWTKCGAFLFLLQISIYLDFSLEHAVYSIKLNSHFLLQFI